MSKDKMTEHDKRIFLWIPDMFQFKGGIQVYSNFFVEAIQNIYPRADYNVFFKNDTHSTPNISFLPQTCFHFAGNVSIPWRTPFFLSQLLVNALRQKPDLIITTHLNFTIAAYWLKKLAQIPYITVAHGIEAWNIQKPTLKKALQCADRILAVSSYTRDRLVRQQNLDPHKVVVLPNTFNSGRFQPGEKPTHLWERYGINQNKFIVLTVARLSKSEKHKGYDKILAALPQIRREIPNVHYLLVGKGDDRPRLEQLINQLQLQDCVTLAGFVPDEELADYYNLCDVFAMPSKKEGFGIVYLEAMACGKPCLAGNQDGALDALCQGELGALVDPDDVEAIAQTLVQILQGTYPNPLIYQPQALRQRVIENFGFEQFQKTLDTLLKLYFC